MKTLIELYDERPLENFLGPEIFKPETVIYLCPQEIIKDKIKQSKMKEYLAHRGVNIETIFVESSLYYANKIADQLKRLFEQYPDCAIDITGGTDAALFAAGFACNELGVPVFTYSRKKNRFFEINNAGFANNLACDVILSVEDYFMMAGGSMRSGRVDNAVISNYFDKIDGFFEVYLSNRRAWPDIVTYIQRISQSPKGEQPPLSVHGAYEVKGEHGSRIRAPENALRELERVGMIDNLLITDGEQVSFEFKDNQTRTWLRDVGSVLEIYIYKECVTSGLFNDVYTSAIVDWDSEQSHGSVSNEIDVMASIGVIPVFISCKTCEIKTEAINELQILRKRFGSGMAKAIIVSTEKCVSAARNRASELNISIIDYDDLTSSTISDILSTIII